MGKVKEFWAKNELKWNHMEFDAYIDSLKDKLKKKLKKRGEKK